jgi:hypothetical protein
VDLRLYARALWRFKWIVVGGTVVAFALAIVSTFHVAWAGSGPRLTQRATQTWHSSATLIVTQPGFPVGRAIFNDVVPLNGGTGTSNGGPAYTSRFADPGRFSDLATLYSQLASGDAVRREILKRGPLPGVFIAGPVPYAPGSSGFLPLISIVSTSHTARGAVSTAARAAEGLRTYLMSEQEASKIPDAERVVVSLIETPRGATRASSGAKMQLMLVFVAAMVAVAALVFLLENARPRLASAKETEPLSDRRYDLRRSA